MYQLFWHSASLSLCAIFSLLLLTDLSSFALAQTYHCDENNPCANEACCGFSNSRGVCGYTEDFCGETCISNCNATAECGKYAEPKGKECPLNVCCSEFGFCGTTDEFCGDGCQGDNCRYPTEPLCSSDNVLERRVIGYYESWATGRECDSWSPEAIAARGLTHIYYAFATFYRTENGNYNIQLMDTAMDKYLLVQKFVALKESNPGLKCYIAIGGWAFNSGETATYWSDMAMTHERQVKFALALSEFVQEYGFDGVDLDWEYPVAEDRGGRPEDKKNFVSLIRTIRVFFDVTGRNYGITFTTPASYWYLRHFDVLGMLESGAEWTNMMTYDLHGVWDAENSWIGPVVGAHTNLTEIKSALDLMWRIGVGPSEIVLGMGFYGRSFTLSDLNCVEPGCSFNAGGHPGPCTGTSGILSFKEITMYLDSPDAKLYTDETAAVNYMVWDYDQWVSFDTRETFQLKVDYANSVCLGGVMIWALDQDTYDWQALSGLLGRNVSGNGLDGGPGSNADSEELSHIYSAYTGQSCYITECVDWDTGQCKDGYSVLNYVHSGSLGMIQDPDDELCKRGSEPDDQDSQYRLICCPTDAMPEGCVWNGAFPPSCGGRGLSCEEVGRRSLCCNTNPALTKCSWSGCGQGCASDEHALSYVSKYAGPNTYKGCGWYGCDEDCPNGKVLITQRTSIDSYLTADTSHCVSGTNKYCCDPPDMTSDLPVDPDDLFKYPDEDDVSYYYKVEEAANGAEPDSDSNDPFALVMFDGTSDAYDESLVGQWEFLSDEQELRKRDLKLHKRQNIFETRNDTFDNVEEKYHIRCSAMAVNASACQSIFEGGAPNTIVKLPKGTGAGPYARVISLVPLGSNKRDVHPRSPVDTYELTVDYDLAAASADRKSNVNFRVDYTNLIGYWNDITTAPPKNRKRWFGGFSKWLSKMTTIVQDEEGSLPLEYKETIKLFHAKTFCPKINTEATFDIDAFLHLGLNAQYGYYFESTVLPSPSLVSAYGYFSILPVAEVLLTMRAEAIMQTHPDPVDIISGLTFPGLSVKGLISIGPEFALTGQMDASLSASGELNAGVALAWDRTSVYFPQDDGGAEASVEPTKLGEDDPKTYSFEPTFNAAVTAKGHMALSLTPKVRFGISVLGGGLMSGYVTAGLTNTVSMGMNASAEVSGDGSTSAGFCYWADYLYSLFLRADISFINDIAYWGGQYDVDSPSNPLTLVEETCISYSNLDKRNSDGPLVAETDDSPCFGGLISCKQSSSTTADSLCVQYSPPDSKLTARNPPCQRIPAMFYNCAGDFFKRVRVENKNQNTRQQHPYTVFPSICENISAYMQNKMGTQGYVGGHNWMKLNYQSESERGNNRYYACKYPGGGSDYCKAVKESLWPVEVQQAMDPNDGRDYQLMPGYVNSVSCDEFPFNMAEEGGAGARTECVGTAQQDYQREVNNIIARIHDKSMSKKWFKASKNEQWKGFPRTFSIHLAYSNNGRPIADSWSYASNNVIPYDRVVGGVDLFDNPDISLGPANAVCAIDGFNEVWQTVDNIYKYYVSGCNIAFEQPAATKRDYDPGDDMGAYVKEVRLLDNWEDTVIGIREDDFDDFLTSSMFDYLNDINQPSETTSSSQDASSSGGLGTSDSNKNTARYLRHRHRQHHNHG